MATNNSLPTNAQIQEYKMLGKLLGSIYTEMKEFSKKKPDEPLNAFKVNTINRVLEKIKVILSDEPTIEYIDILDSVTLPSNSDAIIILGQYNAAMAQFENTYRVHTGFGNYEWNTQENPVGADSDDDDDIYS